MSFFDLKTQSLNGKPVDLGEYRGKVLLVVNTASECGYTPQYDGLEKLYEEMKDQGLVVVGFPSNDFGAQEPGSPEQIQSFCTTRFSVKFPLMQKVHTSGPDQSPVYAFLGKKHDLPKWNFHKYLIGKNGEVRGSYKSSVAPESADLRKDIQAALRE